jgi:CubicO group peptidase (beta-lactamase class C family)
MFTGVAVAQLAEQGKLSFDDPIIKHVPDYANREVAEKVTVHHLLTHTSGMGSYWEEIFDAYWPEIRTVEQLVELFVDKPLDFEPGERFGYSNSGPIVLGLIIERVSGMDYYDYIREFIYQPAGMINTDCYEMDHPVPNLAIGYTRTGYDGETIPGPRRNNLFLHTVKGGPAGGGYSTVEDLLRFANALQNYKLLSKKYTDIVTTGKERRMDRGTGYGYLFGDREVDGHRVIGHSGGAPGINARLAIYVDLGYTVAVMSNYDMAAEGVARKIEKLLIR